MTLQLRRQFLKNLGGVSFLGAIPASKTPTFSRVGAGRTFFVDSELGSDRRDGLSQSAAWKTLVRVNEQLFRPGDVIRFRRGTRYEGQLKPKGSGTLGAPISVDVFGVGGKPEIHALGRYREALLLENQEYWEINNLRLTNLGKTREEFRYGVRLSAWDYGTVHHVQLRNLEVFDVNGSLVKNRGEGQGIVWENGGDRVQSRFDGLLVEGCHLLRTDRNGICGYSRHQSRADWFPSRNVVIRNNLLEDIGGDCIKPWGCDGTLIEHNTVRGGRARCLDAAAGIWPWSSDNTVVQFNEVSGMRGFFDGQAFDTDGNCRNTTFQFNYTHDNDGGFMLMCNDGGWSAPQSAGTSDTVIRYNISQNDRTRLFHFAGPTRNTWIYNNVFWTGEGTDLHVFLWTDYSGWAESAHVYNNIFYAKGVARNSQGMRRRRVEDREQYGTYTTEPGFGGSRGHSVRQNVFFGDFRNLPEEWLQLSLDPRLADPGSGKDGLASLEGYRLREDSPCVGAGYPVAENGGRDFWGNLLPEMGNPSIGAHEPAFDRPLGGGRSAKTGESPGGGPGKPFGSV